jgi:hypothetical protein
MIFYGLYLDLPALIIDVIKHIDEHGDFIEIDNLDKELLFRWKCTKTEKQWAIHLGKIRRLGIWDDKNPLSLHIKRIITDIQDNTPGGGKPPKWRAAVVRDNYITRMVRLIAFW